MRILVVGCGKSNFNYRKIEGFYNSFSKIGETEWVEKMFDCKLTIGKSKFHPTESVKN